MSPDFLTLKNAVFGNKDSIIALKKFLSVAEHSEAKEAAELILSSDVDYKRAYMLFEEYALKNISVLLSSALSSLAEKSGNLILSRYWAKTHRDYFGGTLAQTKNAPPREYYKDEAAFNYSIGGEEKTFSVYSFSKTIGKNMTAVKTPYGVLLFDCGAGALREGRNDITKKQILDFCASHGFKLSDVVGVFVSHAHLDHYGSVYSLVEAGISPNKIYSDPVTLKIIREQEPSFPYINFNVMFYNGKIKVEPFKNGHILGSCGYVINFDKINIVYTGDFSVHRQKTVDGLNANDVLRLGSIWRDGVTLLISESTYGSKIDDLSYADYRFLFSYFTDRYRKLGYKLLFPAFAVGRSQELLSLVPRDIKTLLSGSAINITKIYEKLLNRKYSRSLLRLGDGDGDIIIASSGMLAEGSASYRHAERLLNGKEKCALVLTGYMAEEGYGYDILSEWVRRGNAVLSVPLSAHADRNEIIELIKALGAKRILTVHGDGISGAEYFNISPLEDEEYTEGGFAYDVNTISLINKAIYIGEVMRANKIDENASSVYVDCKQKAEMRLDRTLTFEDMKNLQKADYKI